MQEQLWEFIMIINQRGEKALKKEAKKARIEQEEQERLKITLYQKDQNA